MVKITGLKAGKKRNKQVNVYLDGKYAFSLLAEVVAAEALRVGQELTDNQIMLLSGADRYQRCMDAALRFIGYRPRSESEVRQRLFRHGFDAACIEKALERLKETGLVDDATFARFWKENRETFSPRSRWLTERELRQKGLPDDIIKQAVGDVDDGESAYRAAVTRAGRIHATDYRDFRRRLGDYLGRRGFGYEVINETVERVWREHEGVPG